MLEDIRTNEIYVHWFWGGKSWNRAVKDSVALFNLNSVAVDLMNDGQTS